jgi:hypothetical protein
LAGNCLADEPDYFTGFGVALRGFLGEDAAAVDVHFEHAARGLDETHLGVGICFANFGRQTGGPRFVVSDDAVFNRHRHGVNDSRA